MNYVLAYWEAIERGEVVTSRRVRAVYQRLAQEIREPDPASPYYFDEEVGERPILFAERFCKQSQGVIGAPLALELFQKAYIQALFGFLEKETGFRRYRETMFLVGRKNGKSTLLAAIALYMLIADYEGAAEIYSVATKKDQAKKVLTEAINMVKQSPELRAVLKKRRNDLYFAATASIFEALASDSNTLEGTEAERVASMLVKTQDEGKTSVGELAANMGRVIPSAAAYNVSLENLTTAYALLTKGGMNTAISTTNLGAMLDELAKNGSNVAGILEEQTGKSFAELMASGSNLGDVMTILSESVDGDSTAFSNLWSSSTAGKAALSLLNTGAEEFDRTLNVMANSSGAVEKNFQTMADTTEFAHQRMTNAAENLKIAVGDQLNPSLEKLYELGTDAFTWATDFVNDNPAVVKAVAAVVVGLGTLAAGVTAVVAATAALDVIMAANPIGLIAAATVAAVAAIGTFVLMTTSASEETKAFTESLQETKAAYEELSETMEAEQASTAASAAALEELLAVEEKSAAQKAAISEIVNQLNESVPGLNLAYDEERDALEGLTAAEVSAMVEKAAAQEEYEAQVSRLSELYTEQSEISARLEEAQEALNTAQETGSGNTRTLQNDIDALTAAQEENAAQIAELEEASREYGEQQAEAAAKTQEMTSRVEDITAKMESLQAAYEESYNAAKESIDSQTGRFDIQGIIEGAEAEKANLAATYEDAGRIALSAMERSLPSSVEEPSSSAALSNQTAAIVAAVSGRGGDAGGIAIYIDKLEVRDDQDVERVARELYYLTEQKKRQRGGGSL